jgi:hypothetical protein
MNRRRQRTARGSATTTFAHANSKPVLYKALLFSGTKTPSGVEALLAMIFCFFQKKSCLFF